MVLEYEAACRVTLGLVFIGALSIGIPWRLRADRAGGRVSPRADPRWFWAAMGVAGPALAVTCVAFILQPRWVDFSRLPLPPASRLAGVPLAAAGLALFAWMFRHLGLNVTSTSRPRDNATLVTSGPYRWIRHPMYSTALILISAAALLTANAVVAVSGLAAFALLVARSGVEERRLIEKFGSAYTAYQRRTGRFLPRLRRAPDEV